MRSLTGVKPTHLPHLGNMLGAILPAIALQNTHQAFYFIADYHALTSVKNPKDLVHFSHSVAAVWLALGLDPNKCVFYRQSDVPETVELAWMLSSVVSMGDLFRAHAFKAAKDAGEEGALNHATFSYPVLMAADIVLYDADIVPVGRDQLQHLEMARAAARRFNHYYGNVLKEPQDHVNENVATVPGIDGQKMSKSKGNGINPLDPHKDLKKQVMNIVSDSKGLDDIKDPDTCNIVQIYKAVATPEEVKTMSEAYRKGGYGYGHAKMALLDKIEQRFAPARLKYQELMGRPQDVDAILKVGAEKARKVAREVLERTRTACGIGRQL